MNANKPIVLPGSVLERCPNSSRTNLRVVVFGALGIHLLVIFGLLLQGCKHPDSSAGTGASLRHDGSEAGSLVAAPGKEVAATSTKPPANLEGVPYAGIVPVVTRAYTVKTGDSYSRIANRERTTVQALAQANPAVNPLRLQIGQVLQVPVVAVTSADDAAVVFAAAARAGAKPYTVKQGDSLDRIARQQGTSVRALRHANTLDHDTLLPGQRLWIPAPRTSATAPASAAPTQLSAGLPKA